MQVKIAKCHSKALQGSTGRLIDPKLHLANDTIPYAANGPVKFLGMHIQVPHDTANGKEGAYSSPRLSRLLTIEELSITWVERQLEVMATRYLKKMA